MFNYHKVLRWDENKIKLDLLLPLLTDLLWTGVAEVVRVLSMGQIELLKFIY